MRELKYILFPLVDFVVLLIALVAIVAVVLDRDTRRYSQGC